MVIPTQGKIIIKKKRKEQFNWLMFSKQAKSRENSKLKTTSRYREVVSKKKRRAVGLRKKRRTLLVEEFRTGVKGSKENLKSLLQEAVDFAKITSCLTSSNCVQLCLDSKLLEENIQKAFQGNPQNVTVAKLISVLYTTGCSPDLCTKWLAFYGKQGLNLNFFRLAANAASNIKSVRSDFQCQLFLMGTKYLSNVHENGKFINPKKTEELAECFRMMHSVSVSAFPDNRKLKITHVERVARFCINLLNSTKDPVVNDKEVARNLLTLLAMLSRQSDLILNLIYKLNVLFHVARFLVFHEVDVRIASLDILISFSCAPNSIMNALFSKALGGAQCLDMLTKMYLHPKNVLKTELTSDETIKCLWIFCNMSRGLLRQVETFYRTGIPLVLLKTFATCNGVIKLNMLEVFYSLLSGLSNYVRMDMFTNGVCKVIIEWLKTDNVSMKFESLEVLLKVFDLDKTKLARTMFEKYGGLEALKTVVENFPKQREMHEMVEAINKMYFSSSREEEELHDDNSDMVEEPDYLGDDLMSFDNDIEYQFNTSF